MAATTAQDFVRILRPFRFLSLFSISMASANGYDKSAMYLAYAILSHVLPPVIGWYHMLAAENQKYILFNANGAAFVHWTLNFILNGYLIVTLGKQRIQKLKFEMEKLDKMISFADEALVKKMVVCNTIWLGSIIVYHVSKVLYFGLPLRDAKHLRILITFITVDIAMMSEVACFSCFTTLVYTRLRYFVLHLNLLLTEERRDKGTDVTLCYRQTHRVLGRLVKACQVQIAAVMCYSFYSCLYVLLYMTQTPRTIENTCFDLLSLAVYLGPFVVVGALGQRVGSLLARLRRLALQLEYSPNSELQSAGRCLSSEAAVRARGLHALGARLAGGLPLRAAAALAGALVLMLQLDITPRYD